jgi:hypothetical protein
MPVIPTGYKWEVQVPILQFVQTYKSICARISLEKTYSLSSVTHATLNQVPLKKLNTLPTTTQVYGLPLRYAYLTQ